MPILFAIIAFFVHIVAIGIVLQFIETQWPALHRWMKAVLIATVVSFLIALLRGWICGWLCH